MGKTVKPGDYIGDYEVWGLSLRAGLPGPSRTGTGSPSQGMAMSTGLNGRYSVKGLLMGSSKPGAN